MAEITDRATLAAAIANYAHDSAGDLSTEIDELFIPFALSRIGRDVKALENEKLEPYASAAPPLVLPADFGSIQEVTHQAAGGPSVLEEIEPATGWPLEHDTVSREGDYEVAYHAKPSAALDQSTDLIDEYPQVFLYAALVELYQHQRDYVERKEAIDVYRDEVFQINKQASRRRVAKMSGRRRPIKSSPYGYWIRRGSLYVV